MVVGLARDALSVKSSGHKHRAFCTRSRFAGELQAVHAPMQLRSNFLYAANHVLEIFEPESARHPRMSKDSHTVQLTHDMWMTAVCLLQTHNDNMPVFGENVQETRFIFTKSVVQQQTRSFCFRGSLVLHFFFLEGCTLFFEKKKSQFLN
jgi:hypothetical protein